MKTFLYKKSFEEKNLLQFELSLQYCLIFVVSQFYFLFFPKLTLFGVFIKIIDKNYYWVKVLNLIINFGFFE